MKKILLISLLFSLCIVFHYQCSAQSIDTTQFHSEKISKLFKAKKPKNIVKEVKKVENTKNQNPINQGDNNENGNISNSSIQLKLKNESDSIKSKNQNIKDVKPALKVNDGIFDISGFRIKTYNNGEPCSTESKVESGWRLPKPEELSVILSSLKTEEEYQNIVPLIKWDENESIILITNKRFQNFKNQTLIKSYKVSKTSFEFKTIDLSIGDNATILLIKE